jgi:serine/threonine protein kinase
VAPMTSVLPEPLAEGRFQLLEVIGEGGMATVYRAFDQRLQRPRAIKVLSPALSGRPALRRRFMAEAQTMATLEESRVVRIFDVAEEGDRCYIVMELVDGGSLLDRIRDYGPLPPRMAATVALQLCESLQAAHDAGVIHRDIKPHNILLTRVGELRITDFGIAQVQQEGGDGLTKTGAVMGTWGFMAPEQKSDAKNVDARADLYSVGATLWALLRGDTPPELFMADQEPQMLDAIPDVLAEVIRRATRYRREERYPTVRAMADSIRSLTALLPEDPPETRPLVMPPLAGREGRTPIDTIEQFRTPPPQPVMGTMVPDMAELPPLLANAPAAAPAAPILIAPPGPAMPTGVDLSFDNEDSDAERADRRWMLYGGIGLMGLGLAAVIAVGKLWDPGAGPVAESALAEAAPPATQVQPPGAAALPVPGGTPASGTVAGATAATASTVAASSAARSGAPAATVPAAASPLAGAVVAAAAEPPPASPEVAVADADPAAAAPPVTEPPPDVHVAPHATHLTVSAASAAHVGDGVAVSASMAPGYALTLYYRAAGAGPFHEKSMAGADGTYATTLKVDESMAAGVEYFVAATDDRGNTTREGSALKPLRIDVVP